MYRLLLYICFLSFAATPAHAQILASSDAPASTASFYHTRFHGLITASGETYDHNALTAAHNVLPFNTMVRVTRLDNGRAVVVRINDRMASDPVHTIDLSGAAAERIGLDREGITHVRIDVLANDGPEDGRMDNTTAEARPRVIGWSATPVEKNIVRTVAEPRKMVPLVPSGPPAESNVRTKVEPAKSNTSELTFTLQIGSFSTRDGAKVMADRYDTAWVAEVVVNGVESYRVYYSRFEAEAPARLAQQALWKDGQDSFLRRVNS